MFSICTTNPLSAMGPIQLLMSTSISPSHYSVPLQVTPFGLHIRDDIFNSKPSSFPERLRPSLLSPPPKVVCPPTIHAISVQRAAPVRESLARENSTLG